MRIGIDFGNVICGGGGDDTQFFGDNWQQTPEVAGAYDSIKGLKLMNHEIHIISKCGTATEFKSVYWLTQKGFVPFAVMERRLNFVRKRELKAPLCQALQIEIFIDDRQDIIDSLEGVVRYPILFQSWEQVNDELEKIFAAEG